MERNRRGKQDVLDVVFPQQARFARDFLRRRMQDESAAHRGNRHIRCPHVRVRAVMQAAEALFFLRAVIEFTADCAVIREKAAAIRRNSVHQFIFRIFDVLQGMEGVQMLRADARQHAVTRMHQSTQFLDIPDVPCAHFRHKHLRRRRQALTDDFRHAHRRIEAARGNQRLILLLQNRAENELDARLAVAAGNADFDDVRARRQFLLRVAEIHFAHKLFNRPRQQSAQRHPERQKYTFVSSAIGVQSSV